MDSDKIKVRVPDFISAIINYDAKAFGFVKSNNQPNINAFLNQIIPNLFYCRKHRRKEIHDSLDETLQYSTNEKIQERIRNRLDTIIDDVYFSGKRIETLNETLWIRPSNHNLAIFDEIIESETKITALNLSEYIRSLLIEYARLPQYRRETICFLETLNLLRASYYEDYLFKIKYNSESYCVVVIDFLYGYLTDQSNYIICYDINRNVLKAFKLHKILYPYQLDKKFDFSKHTHILEITYKKYIDENIFLEKETYELTD